MKTKSRIQKFVAWKAPISQPAATTQSAGIEISLLPDTRNAIPLAAAPRGQEITIGSLLCCH